MGKTSQRLSQLILLLIEQTKNQREIREEMSDLGHLISIVYKSKFHSNQNSLCLQMKKSFSALLDTAVDISVIPVVNGLQNCEKWRLFQSYKGSVRLKILNKVGMSFTERMEKVMKELFSHTLFLIYL